MGSMRKLTAAAWNISRLCVAHQRVARTSWISSLASHARIASAGSVCLPFRRVLLPEPNKNEDGF